MVSTIPVSRAPKLIVPLALVLLAGLTGCGPAPSDNASRLISPVEANSTPGPRPSSETRSPQTALVGNPAPTAPARDHSSNPAAPLVVPDSLSDALASPDVRVRLRALDRWAAQNRENQEAEVDPLMVALEDDDERVRAKALALIERAGVQEQAATER
jgi:hypothetical protein